MHWNIFEHTNLWGQHDRRKRFFIGARSVLRNKPAGAGRVVCLGSSSTAGAGLADSWNAYPALLDQMFPDVEVINAGCAGYSSYMLSIFLADVLVALDPDVVTFYYGGNEGYGNADKSFYPKAKNIVKKLLERNVAEIGELENAVLHGTANRFALTAYRLLDQSKAFLLLRHHLISARRRTLVLRHLDNDEIQPWMLPRTETILENMADLCRRHEIVLIFIPEVGASIQNVNPLVTSTMENLCAQEKAKCVDAVKGKPGLTSPTQFLDTTHLTVEGHRRLAATLAPAIRNALAHEDL